VRRLLLGLAVGVMSGMLVGFILARGPITTGQAVDMMLVGLLIGAVAARLSPTRWTLLLAPLGFFAGFAVAHRAILSGPTIDSFQPDSFYGVLALILGRIVLVMATLPSMLLGAALALRVRRWVSFPLAILAAAIAIGTVLPASTPPILGPDGKPLPGSIASLESVRLGGHEQWLTMRGQNVSNPVLLYLSGGPGQSDLPYVRVLFNNLEQDFVVVDWDQRGTGKSYPPSLCSSTTGCTSPMSRP